MKKKTLKTKLDKITADWWRNNGSAYERHMFVDEVLKIVRRHKKSNAKKLVK